MSKRGGIDSLPGVCLPFAELALASAINYHFQNRSKHATEDQGKGRRPPAQTAYSKYLSSRDWESNGFASGRGTLLSDTLPPTKSPHTHSSYTPPPFASSPQGVP